MKLKYFIFILAISSEAFATDTGSSFVPEIRTVNGAKEVWVNTPSGPTKFGDVEVIPKGTKLYNWGDAETATRWAAQGHVDLGEIKALRNGTEAVGGGVYVSTDFWDSSNYGPKLAVFTTTQDVTALTKPSENISLIWDSFNERLVSIGIDGVGKYNFNSTWFNFFDTKPLLDAKVGTWRDFEESAFSKTDLGLSTLLSINSRIPLQDTPWVQDKFPVISQILRHTLDVSTLDPKVKKQFIDWLIESGSAQDQSPLTKNILTLFKSELILSLNSSYYQMANSARSQMDWSRTGNELDLILSKGRRLGIPYPSWIPEVEQPISVFPAVVYLSLTEKDSPRLPYSKALNEHLAYLNIDDFLGAIAQGKPIDKIYDTPGMSPYSERWKAANQQKLMDPEGSLGFHRKLTGNAAADFRDGPAGSDGDIVWQGKKYFQVNDQQIRTLKINPFITPEFQSIPDPGNPEKTIKVARYEYPTAANFEKYSRYLSESTKQTLAAAKSAGTLNDLTTPEARILTKKMISELADWNSKNYRQLTATDIKLFFLALHPFNEMNAETAAVISFVRNNHSKNFYDGNRTVPGKPDAALLMTRKSFHGLAIEDSAITIALQKAFARAERDNPQFPRYFDVPELWQAGRKVANIGSDPVAFVQQSKAFYASSPTTLCMVKNMDATLSRGGEK